MRGTGAFQVTGVGRNYQGPAQQDITINVTCLSKEGSLAWDSKSFESRLKGSSPSTRMTDTVTPATGKSPLTKAEPFSYPLKTPEDSNLLHQSKTNCHKGLSPPKSDGVNPTPSHEG
jgi:hypothetical protein